MQRGAEDRDPVPRWRVNYEAWLWIADAVNRHTALWAGPRRNLPGLQPPSVHPTASRPRDQEIRKLTEKRRSTANVISGPVDRDRRRDSACSSGDAETRRRYRRVAAWASRKDSNWIPGSSHPDSVGISDSARHRRNGLTSSGEARVAGNVLAARTRSHLLAGRRRRRAVSAYLRSGARRPVLGVMRWHGVAGVAAAWTIVVRLDALQRIAASAVLRALRFGAVDETVIDGTRYSLRGADLNCGIAHQSFTARAMIASTTRSWRRILCTNFHAGGQPRLVRA